MMHLRAQLKEDGSRLLWINLLSLKDLAPVLDQLFTLLQRTGTWDQRDETNVNKCNEKLKKVSSLVSVPDGQRYWLLQNAS